MIKKPLYEAFYLLIVFRPENKAVYPDGDIEFIHKIVIEILN